MAIRDLKIQYSEEQFLALVALYATIASQVQESVSTAAKKQLTTAQKTVVLGSIAALLEERKVRTNILLGTIIPDAYKLGIIEANKLMPASLRHIALTPAHAEFVNSLLAKASTTFGVGLEGVLKSADTALSQVIQQQMRTRMLEGKLAGKALKEISEEVLKDLVDKGFTTFVRRDGRAMNLKSYAEMVTRTEIRNAANQGIYNRSVSLGVTVYTCSLGGGKVCDICAESAGETFDITGKKYPKPPDWFPGLAHPNCTHVWIPEPSLSLL